MAHEQKEQSDIYEALADPDFEMDMYPKEEWKSLAKIYGGAFVVVIFGILPWCLGMAMLTKWILF